LKRKNKLKEPINRINYIILIFQKVNKMKIKNKNKIGSSAILYVVLFLITNAYGISINREYNKLPHNYEIGPKVWFVSPELITLSKGQLLQKDIDINDIDALKKATTSSDYIIRTSAYHIFALQAGEKAIPTLQSCLNNSGYNEPRYIARYLALLGDQSGLKKLHDEITVLTKYENEIDSSIAKIDPNNKETPPFGMRTKLRRTAHCLYAAITLADFGDSFGYEIAAKLALESEIQTERSLAMQVLTKLTRIDMAEQKVRGIDPEGVLLKMVETEKDRINLEQNIPAYVLSDIKPESQLRIFEKLIQSPNMSGEYKQRYSNTVKRLQKQIEKEKQVIRTDN
jgi:hypothetical protein